MEKDLYKLYAITYLVMELSKKHYFVISACK